MIVNEERLLKSFLEMVQISSESRHEKCIGEKIAAVLSEMGLEVICDRAGETFGSDGFNVFARLPGTIPGPPVMLSAHMDTVSPGTGVRAEVRHGVITTDGTSVLGGDDKCGICGILEALQTVTERGIAHRETEIVFSVGEEVGLRGAKSFDCSIINSKRAYIFDAEGDVGTVVVKAPANVSVWAKITGRRAHAGVEPERGISAIQAAGRAIAKMKLLRISEETTCNIGTIKAESPTNIVPETCSLIAEVRSQNQGELEAQIQHLRDCLQTACDELGAVLELKVKQNYDMYSFPLDSDIVCEFSAAAQRIGVKPIYVKSGGGSDANVYCQRGIDAVAVGVGMSKVHTTEEYLTITLGDTTISFVETPGHTKGTISFFFDVQENDRVYRVGSFGGAGANTLAKGKLEYPEAREDYRGSLKRLRKEHVDVFVGNHVWNNNSEVFGKLLLETGENKFIDETMWPAFLDYCEERLNRTIAADTDE